MKTSHIRFATDILRRLGEELNPSADQSILELVKNAYDADALSCVVEIGDADKGGGWIRIVDDGKGMTPEQIENGFLVLGRSGKASSGKTLLGRVPVGSKGLGRLAALRMGHTATLHTTPITGTREYHLTIEWDRYDNAALVDDVPLKIDSTPRSKPDAAGTEILLTRLRSPLGRMDVKRIARALILLADPFTDSPRGFRPTLLAQEFHDLEALVKTRYFGDAEYRLVGKLKPDGTAEAAVYDFRGQVVFQGGHSDVASDPDVRYESPAATFELWSFKLVDSAFTGRTATLSDVRQWLASFGGVHIYQDGVRVTPYGNAGNDWLDMNLSRAKSPEERPSTNNSIGRVTLAEPGDRLMQKTDRSGFIENRAFNELRRFAIDCLEWMAARRLDVAEKRRAASRKQAPKESVKAEKEVQTAIDALPSNAQAPVRDAFGAYQKRKEKEVRTLRKEVELYRTLSTVGITAATFAHESTGNPIKAIETSIDTIARRARVAMGAEVYAAKLKQAVDRIVRSSRSLAAVGGVFLNLLQHEKRRVSLVDLHRVLNDLLSAFALFIDGHDVSLSLEFCSGNPMVRGTESAIESIVANLINNSLAFLEEVNVPDRKILVRTSRDGDERVTIAVLDNGPGIQGIPLKELWLPGRTTKARGTGLGLTIVRDSALDLGGKVDVIKKGELGGAEFLVHLPLARV